MDTATEGSHKGDLELSITVMDPEDKRGVEPKASRTDAKLHDLVSDDPRGNLELQIFTANGNGVDFGEKGQRNEAKLGEGGENDEADSLLTSPVPEEEPLIFKMDEDDSESDAPKLAEGRRSSSSSGTNSSPGNSVLGQYMEGRKNAKARKGDQEGDQGDEGKSSNEWDDDEYPRLNLNHKALLHVATYYMPGGHGKCINVTELTRGTYHEIRVLHFQDGWSCIGRFTRSTEQLGRAESGIATLNYVKEHTSIPVPEIYFTNHNENHAVGAPFVLMELLPGQHLYRLWDDLSLEHKLHVIHQITDVLAQLAGLNFDRIGCLQANGVGPLFSHSYGQQHTSKGPFVTMEEYMLSFKPKRSDCTDARQKVNNQIANELMTYVRSEGQNPLISAPYRLIHGDFDAQNMLFEQSDPVKPPKLCGVIDWDYSYAGPLYELFEYPIFIQDVHWSQHLYAENKILRENFVRSLAKRFSKGSAGRTCAHHAFRHKNYLLQNFADLYASAGREGEDDETELRKAKRALETIKAGNGMPYEGRIDWQPDDELEIEDHE